jgi:hypothetical protein
VLWSVSAQKSAIGPYPETLQVVKNTLFWEVTYCNVVDIYRLKEEHNLSLSSGYTASIFSVEERILKIEARGSSETSVPFCQATQNHISESSSLQNIGAVYILLSLCIILNVSFLF